MRRRLRTRSADRDSADGFSRTHSSISTWALIPPKPKPLMAARRGWPAARAGQGSGWVRTRNGLFSKPSWGPARSKFAVGGRMRCLSASRTLSNPAAPAAVSAWPMFDLTEPIAHWRWLPADSSPERLEALDLDGVADRGAGGVALDQVDVAGAPAGLLVGHAHRAELAFGAGRQQVAVEVVRQADRRRRAP